MVNGSGRGRTNGLTNGTGRTNGFTNGRGRTNGQGRTNGLTNGMGRTNGQTNGLGRTNGMTNGFGPGRFNDQGAVHPRKLSLILIIVFVIIMPVSLGLLIQSQPVPGQVATIDGKFGEWDKFTRYVDTAQCADGALDIVEFSVAADGTDFFAYINAHDVLTARSTVDRYFAFIDADGDAATGYATLNLGAEYVVEAYGHDGEWAVNSAKFQGTDRSNWSAVGTIGPGHAESQGTELEMRASLDAVVALGVAARIRFASMTGSEIADVCDPIVDGVNGALVISQTPQDAAGIVSTSTLLSLQLRAVGKDVTVSALAVESREVATNVISGFTTGVLTVNNAMPVQVTRDVVAMADGALVTAKVTSATVAAGTVSIIGNPLAAYAKVAPASVAIDGAFADWNNVAKTSDTASDVDNLNIDIVEEAAATQSGNFLAYVRFNGAGQTMSGMAVPQARTVPSGGGGGDGGGGGTTILPRVAGEDLCRFYIDSVAGGSSIGGIAADYVLELRGKNGVTLSKNLYTYPARALVASVSAENGASAIEASVPLASIGSPAGTVRVYVETTDWERTVDVTTSIQTNILTGATRDIPVGPILQTGTLSAIAAPPTSETITIDGSMGASEWNDADTYTSGTDYKIYTVRSSTDLFIAIKFTADTQKNALDYCNLVFSQTHPPIDEIPQFDDRLFSISNTNTGLNILDNSGGNGGGWEAYEAAPWAAAANLDGSSILYEWRIPFIEVWGASNPVNNQVAGFAIQMHDQDGAGDKTWGGDSVDNANPTTWGDVTYDTPEFPPFAVPIILCAIPFIAFRARRKPRNE